MNITLPTWLFALILVSAGSIVTGTSMYIVFLHNVKTQPFQAVTVEIAKLIVGEARAQCDKMKCKEFTVKADGLQVGVNFKK